jgi:hypothetical protein
MRWISSHPVSSWYFPSSKVKSQRAIFPITSAIRRTSVGVDAITVAVGGTVGAWLGVGVKGCAGSAVVGVGTGVSVRVVVGAGLGVFVCVAAGSGASSACPPADGRHPASRDAMTTRKTNPYAVFGGTGLHRNLPLFVFAMRGNFKGISAQVGIQPGGRITLFPAQADFVV